MADLNAIAHGVDSETGEYLSSEDRKAIFKNKGKMGSKIKPKSFRSGIVTATRGSDNKGGGGLVKFSGSSITKVDEKVEEKETAEEDKTFETDEVHNLFEEIRSTFYEVHQVKNDKKRLQSKFLEVLSKSNQTSEPKKETTPEKKSGMGIGKKILGATTGLFSNVFGIIGDLLKFAVLDFISKPENKKIVEAFTKILTGVFKFLNWFITGTVDNLLTGFAELVGGDSMLEKIGGFFKLVLGVVGLRWLLNPLKILKDLKSIFKFGKKFVKIFKGIFKLGGKGLKNSFGGILKLAGKAFRKTLGRMIQRVLLKVFGKAITKGMVAVTKTVVKSVGKVVRKIPAIGPLIGIAVDLAFGTPIDEALVRAAGALLGSALGATLAGTVGTILGSVVPVIGNLLLGSAAATAGGVLGSFAGEWIAVSIYKGVKGLFGGKKEEKKEDTPELASGGVVSGPEEGYLAILHGTEAVIPIAKIPEILTLPFKLLGSNIIGAIFAVINSLGPVGGFVKPIAVSLLAPAMKLFGVETFTKSSNVGDTKGDAETLSRHVESEQEKQDLDKLFGKDLLKDIGTMLMISGGSLINSIMGGSAQAKSSSGGGSSDIGALGGDYPPSTDNGSTSSVGDMPGSGTSKGTMIAKMLQKDMGISGAAAAGIVGNLLLESGLQSDNVENGKGFDDGPISNIPPGTRRVGYGWGQWTNDRLEKFRNFLRARGKENQPASDQDNYDYLLHELRTSEPIRGHWKGWQGPNIPEDDPQKAATWFMMNWERPGVPHQDKRQKYAQTIFNSLGSTSAQTAQQSTPPATPGQNLTPEQKSSMFQKSGMSAMAANTLSSAKPSTPAAASTTPTTPAAKMTSSPPRSSSMVPMSNNFSITRNISNNKQNVSMTIVKMSNTRKSNLNNMQAPLNNTSISESIINNRI